MDWYRIRFTLGGASGNRQWQADTLFGHLCWSLRYQAGEVALQEFLGRYRQGDPPLLLSNGFPEGWLPRPLHTTLRRPSRQRASIEEEQRAFRAGREAKRVVLLSEEDFEAVRRGEPWQPGASASSLPSFKTRVTLKNQISRTTGTTGEGGQFFGFVEHWQPTVVVYCQIAPDFVQDAELLVMALAEDGFGKRRSVGYGHIREAEFAPFGGFPASPDANGFVSLSNFVPAAGDPTDGLWRAFVKYGKLGEEWATGPDPFKRPLIMLEAGSVFRDNPVRPFYGRLVAGVSEAHPEVVQYGYALPVPLVWTEDGP